MLSVHQFRVIVSKEDLGKRSDIVIANLMPDRSRSYVAEMIRAGNIRVNHQIIKPAYKLKAGDDIVGLIPAPEPLTIEAQDIALNIVYEDHDLLVIDKACGIVVHPAPGHFEGTIVNAILHHCPDLGEIGGKIRPGIVHRLDKDTSGLLIIAKNDMAHQHLALQFKARTLHKEYLAIVHGNMEKNSGVISLSIGRHPTDRKKMSVISRYGRVAETLWTVTERFNAADILAITLKTGRTHQIRVHCAAVGHPIVGDAVYGSRNKTLTADRQMLHAWKLRCVHPRTGETVHFEAPIPDDMNRLIESLQTESDKKG
jgi:23S rRNA pseudouridine1911/1915/1917 synthase